MRRWRPSPNHPNFPSYHFPMPKNVLAARFTVFVVTKHNEDYWRCACVNDMTFLASPSLIENIREAVEHYKRSVAENTERVLCFPELTQRSLDWADEALAAAEKRKDWRTLRRDPR